jgi:hypothetical protein
MEQTVNYSRYKTLFSILALVVFIWGVLGALEVNKMPYAGYSISPDNVVTQVRKGSPAEKAGLQVGDTITRIDNIAIEDFAALTNRGRPAIDSEATLTVKRGEAEQTLTLRYASLPMSDLLAGRGVGLLSGLLFLILGLWVYLKNPTRLSTTFCSLSLLFAFLLFGGPYFASPAARRLSGAILEFATSILLALILTYSLDYPRTKKIIADRRWLRQAIYLIAIVVGVMLATIVATTPSMGPGFSMALSTIMNVIWGGYLLLAVISVIHSYVKASAEERSLTGLNFLMLGMVIGFVPGLISIVVHTIAPHMGELPGERFWGITLLALPIGLALALMKLEPAPAAAKAEEKPAT